MDNLFVVGFLSPTSTSHPPEVARLLHCHCTSLHHWHTS